MSDQISDLYLPEEVKRPLHRAMWILGLFLVGFGVWATQAEFSTTLKIPGETGSTAPSIEIQHPEGGQLQAVHIALHAHVQAGDLLFRLDTQDADLRQEALRRIRRICRRFWHRFHSA